MGCYEYNKLENKYIPGATLKYMYSQELGPQKKRVVRRLLFGLLAALLVGLRFSFIFYHLEYVLIVGFNLCPVQKSMSQLHTPFSSIILDL